MREENEENEEKEEKEMKPITHFKTDDEFYFFEDFRKKYVERVEKILNEYSELYYLIDTKKQIDPKFRKVKEDFIVLFFDKEETHYQLHEVIKIHLKSIAIKDINTWKNEHLKTHKPCILKIHDKSDLFYFILDGKMIALNKNNPETMHFLSKIDFNASKLTLSKLGDEVFYKEIIQKIITIFLDNYTPIFDKLNGFRHGYYVKDGLKSLTQCNDMNKLEEGLIDTFYYFRFKGENERIKRIDSFIETHFNPKTFDHHPYTNIQSFESAINNMFLWGSLKDKFRVHFGSDDHNGCVFEGRLRSGISGYVSDLKRALEISKLENQKLSLNSEAYKNQLFKDVYSLKQGLALSDPSNEILKTIILSEPSKAWINRKEEEKQAPIRIEGSTPLMFSLEVIDMPSDNMNTIIENKNINDNFN